jgi:hypothetical protein
MRTHPHLVHPGQKQHYSQTQQQQQQQQQQQHHLGQPPQIFESKLMGVAHEQTKKHKRSAGGPYLSQQRSFSSSEEDLRSTPEYDGKFLHFLGLYFKIKFI